jgi:hypothetical protein
VSTCQAPGVRLPAQAQLPRAPVSARSDPSGASAHLPDKAPRGIKYRYTTSSAPASEELIVATVIVIGLVVIGVIIGSFMLWLIIESAVHNGTLRALKEHHQWLDSRSRIENVPPSKAA